MRFKNSDNSFLRPNKLELVLKPVRVFRIQSPGLNATNFKLHLVHDRETADLKKTIEQQVRIRRDHKDITTEVPKRSFELIYRQLDRLKIQSINIF